MSKTYNIYIDETCHLEHDKLPVMCIGYTKIDNEDYSDLKYAIKGIKLKHKSPTEIKWNKLSMSRLPLYKELIDFFFEKEIQFRCVLIKNKQNLSYEKIDNNNFYYNVVFWLLNDHINPIYHKYRVILDIKDTRGRDKIKHLDLWLKQKNGGKSPFSYFQHIRSHENELLQITDLFIGAITYSARGEHTKQDASPVKKEVIKYLEKKSGYSLDDGTIPWDEKFNISDFQVIAPK